MSGREGRWGERGGEEEEEGKEMKVRFLHACGEHDFELQSTRLTSHQSLDVGGATGLESIA